jgi:hypothetical protein
MSDFVHQRLIKNVPTLKLSPLRPYKKKKQQTGIISCSMKKCNVLKYLTLQSNKERPDECIL